MSVCSLVVTMLLYARLCGEAELFDRADDRGQRDLALIELDLGHAIEHITVPALVTVGDVDRLTPPASALAIKRMLPDGRMFVFNGSGHCTMLERHTQFNRVVAGFLEEALEAEQEDTTPKRDERTPA